MTTELTAANVSRVFEDSLFTEDEVADISHHHYTVEQVLEMPEDERPFVPVEGVIHDIAFHPDRLRSHRDEVHDMLMQLPEEFRQHTGGGHSFLNAAGRADGVLWGEHMNVEQLLTLGIGLGLARWLMPKQVWAALPGGMPYVVVMDEEPAAS
jgi:hypothetical protein